MRNDRVPPLHRALGALLVLLLSLGLTIPPATASSRSAGGLKWYSVRTDHFIVHYPVSRGEPADPRAVNASRVAQRAALAAEQLYARYAELLRTSLPGPVHIVLDEQLDTATNLAEPEWLRITLSTRPGPMFPLRGQEDWLRAGIAHELAHIFLLHAGSPVPPGMVALLECRVGDRGWLNRAAGEPVAANPELLVGLRAPLADPAPFFWTEGGAEFLADLAGADRWDPARDMILRMATLEDLILSPGGWRSGLGKVGLDGERAYNQGYSFMLFLRERYGEESFARIVQAARKKLRLDWIDAFEEGQGITFEALYGIWRTWLQERYQPLADLKNREVVGEELSLSTPPWRSADLEVRRRWMAQPATERQTQREGEAPLALYPAWSGDGRFLAYWQNGLKIRAIPEEQWPVYGGLPLEAFRDRLELARRERRMAYLPQARQYPVSWAPDGRRLVVVADEAWRPRGGTGRSTFHWNALFLVDVQESRSGAISLSVPSPGLPIPNTHRAQDPAFSPDGKWIAFVRYLDGTGNLWVIRPDGSEARQLTKFTDGTDMGHPSWSPDGKSLVFHMYRRNQRDLWLIDVGTQALQPVMLDAANDLDPRFGPDGRIYYSSDLSGIFNLYSYDPSTLEVRRITDVLGGAFSPAFTPRGNLTFSYFDGYAFKLYGLKGEKAADLPVDNAAFFIDPSLTQGYLLGMQEATAAEGHRYRMLEGGPDVRFIPTLRVTERDVAGGVQLLWEDPLEQRSLQVRALAGMGSLVEVELTDAKYTPRLNVGLIHRSREESAALQVASGEVGQVIERRREQLFRAAHGGIDLPVSARMRLGLSADVRASSFRERADGAGQRPLHAGFGGGPELVVSSFRRSVDHGVRGIDPRGGTLLSARYQLRQARVYDPETSGPIVEQGDLLGAYLYHRLDLELFQALALPWRAHTLEWRLNVGALSRNVAWWDELKAGSRLATLDPKLDPFVLFPGYDETSLSGETLGVLAVAYRVPLRTGAGSHVGPFYVDAVYGQVGGTLGNVWGYREEGEGAVREQPLEDVSSRNSAAGQGQKMVSEVGLELRVQASLWNRFRWGSFFRVGYALNLVTGVGDVDRDGTYPGLYGDVAPVAGDEVVPAGLRFAVGLGTGF